MFPNRFSNSHNTALIIKTNQTTTKSHTDRGEKQIAARFWLSILKMASEIVKGRERGRAFQSRGGQPLERPLNLSTSPQKPGGYEGGLGI